MIILGATTVFELSPVFLAEIFMLNGSLSLIAAYYLRKSGFLAPIGIHFWADILWHVIWGLAG